MAKKSKYYSSVNGVFVVNQKHQIVYSDESLHKMENNLQNLICYKAFFDKDKPCQKCPFDVLHKDNTAIEYSLRYIKQLKTWHSFTVLKLNWPNEGECLLIAVRPINDEHRKVFLNLNQDQHYDELLEIDLKQKTYQYLYKDEKEIQLDDEGSIEELLSNFSERYVYPDDIYRFQAFFDLNTLVYRTENMGHVVEDFRILRSDNDYHYMSLYLQPVQKSKSNISYLCYAVNVDERYNGRQTYFHKDYTTQIDSLTYLYNQETFVKLVKDRLNQNKKTEYAMVVIDIEHFKLFNEWYGTEEGDKLLKYVAQCIQNYLKDKDGYASRNGNDDFTCFLPYQYCHEDDLENVVVEWIQNYDNEYKFLPVVGVYRIIDMQLPITLMCDRAAMAANSIKGNFVKRVSMYQETMKLKLENEQEVLFSVKNGLENEEFDIYFQPQCSARTKKIIGAEVLVRWNHPAKGLLMPNSFIPILESSGFIYKLDYYVWEKACQYIHQRIENDEEIIPLSVNVSRLDIYQYNLVEVFEELCEKYQVPKRYIAIEITESAYSENVGQLADTISEMRSCGFKVLMDDFGSGYSSLNMLKDVEIDVLKLDMKFLDMNENSLNKGLSVLESSILMAKWLKMGLIAEGVETDEQVKHLLNMNCEFMQGFRFYKPMPQADFDKLLSQQDRLDTRDVMVDNLPALQVADLFHKDITSEFMLNNILGGIAIYEVDEHNNVTVKTVNDGYYNITGCNSVDLNEKSKYIIQQVHKDDRDYVLDIFRRAEKSGHLGASGTFRRYRLNGEMMWMHLKAFFLHKEKNNRVYYGAISDFTKEMEREEELDAILKTVPGSIIKYTIEDDHLKSKVLGFGLDHVLGYKESEIKDIFDKKQELKLISQDYQTEIINFFKNYHQWKEQMDIQFPCIAKNGEEIWVHEHIIYYDCIEGVDVYCGFVIDKKDECLEKEI